jgi:hypothetical protein
VHTATPRLLRTTEKFGQLSEVRFRVSRDEARPVGAASRKLQSMTDVWVTITVAGSRDETHQAVLVGARQISRVFLAERVRELD